MRWLRPLHAQKIQNPKAADSQMHVPGSGTLVNVTLKVLFAKVNVPLITVSRADGIDTEVCRTQGFTKARGGQAQERVGHTGARAAEITETKEQLRVVAAVEGKAGTQRQGVL